MSYIDGQKKLQQQILNQARAFGMKLILGGFAGHVPEALKTVKPDAGITGITPGWGEMEAKYATWFVDPTDPLFREIQVRFLKKQEELYGTDHLYGADPFNEIPPPSWEPDYLANVSKANLRVAGHLMADRHLEPQDPQGDVAVVLPEHHFRPEHPVPRELLLLAIGRD